MPICNKCINQVGRLWQHPRITAIGFPEGICTTCYVGEKESWPNSALPTTIAAPPVDERKQPRVETKPALVTVPPVVPLPSATIAPKVTIPPIVEKPDPPVVAKSNLKPCKSCGKDKKPGLCPFCSKDGRRIKKAAPGREIRRMPVKQESPTFEASLVNEPATATAVSSSGDHPAQPEKTDGPDRLRALREEFAIEHEAVLELRNQLVSDLSIAERKLSKAKDKLETMDEILARVTT